MSSEAMTSWMEILDEPLFRKLSVVLLHFLWQAGVVALAYAGLDLAARRRGARSTVRYALACAALAVMVAVPLWTFAASGFAATSSETPGSDSAAGSPSAFETAGTAMTSLAGDAPARVLATLSGWADRAAALRPFCMAAWLAGVAALSLRLVLGWTVATRLTRRGAVPARPELAAAMARLARRLSLSRPVRLLESAAVQVPVALGVLRPAILLPLSGLTGLSTQQIEALLAHELAHVHRNDYLVNLLQSAAETLFFYHPAVWWVSGRIRAERENCCDDLAVSVTGDARLYACALVDLEERRGGRRALAVAADGGDLLRRVARLFPAAAVRTPGHTRRVAGGVALSALLLTGAALRVGPGDPNPSAVLGLEPADPPAEETATRNPRAASTRAKTAPAQTPAGFVRASRGPEPSSADPTPRVDGAGDGAGAATEADADSGPEPSPSDDVVVVAAGKPGPSQSPSPSGSPSPSPSGDDRTDAGSLTLDEIRSLRIHNVTPEFVAQIRALGYTRATVDDLVSLRIHGVTPENIAAFQKLFGKVSLERAVEFEIHGVTPAFVEEMRNAGLRLSPEQAVSMRIHGATPEFVKGIKDAGFGDVSSDGIVSLRIHGVDVAFAKEMRSLGFADASLDELTSFRIHGVTPEFVRQVNGAGLTGLSADEATSLRIHGVTPEFLRDLKTLKVRVDSADDATSLRIHGVTTSFVRSVEAEGYAKPTVDELTALRIHGVTVEDIRRTNRAAGRKLPLEEIVDEKIDGGERSFEWNR